MRTSEITIGALAGTWTTSPRVDGVVLFAHGSGSSRFSVRNRAVAASLQYAGYATLLMDLLTPTEERVDDVTRELRFDIPLLAERLQRALAWIERERGGRSSTAIFGASTGAAAALVAAAETQSVRAVVSRGGRPDLAGDALERVRAPTLLIVGGEDREVLRLNERAFERMACAKELVVVPGATHLFEEPGALERVASDTIGWLRRWMPADVDVSGAQAVRRQPQ